MGLLLDLEDNVTGQDARSLVTLAAELDARTALNTAVDVDVQHLAINDSLLAVAVLAAILVLDDLSFSVTVGARRLEALDHGTHLAHHRLHAVAITARAALHRALLSTATLALRADDGALQSQLGDLAAVNVLERDLVGVVDGARLRRARIAHAAAEHAAETAAAAKELGEEVLGSHATAAAAALQARLSHLVVQTSLLGIGQNFVCVRDLLELMLGLSIAWVLVCADCYYAFPNVTSGVDTIDNNVPGWNFKAFFL